MNFKPIRMYDSLDTGTYKGIVKEISFSNDRYCTFKIEVEEQEGLFVQLFSTNDIALNNFACEFVDEQGCFCPDNAIDTNITFAVKQRIYNGNTLTKVTKMSVA